MYILHLYNVCTLILDKTYQIAFRSILLKVCKMLKIVSVSNLITNIYTTFINNNKNVI